MYVCDYSFLCQIICQFTQIQMLDCSFVICGPSFSKKPKSNCDINKSHVKNEMQRLNKYYRLCGKYVPVILGHSSSLSCFFFSEDVQSLKCHQHMSLQVQHSFVLMNMHCRYQVATFPCFPFKIIVKN